MSLIWRRDKIRSPNGLFAPALSCVLLPSSLSVQRVPQCVSESHAMSRWLLRPTPPRQLRPNIGFVGFVIRSNLVSTWSILQSLQSKGSGASITSSSEYLTSQSRCCSRVESSSHSSFSFALISKLSQHVYFVVKTELKYFVLFQWGANKIQDKFSSESLPTGFATTGITHKDSEKQTEVSFVFLGGKRLFRSALLLGTLRDKTN